MVCNAADILVYSVAPSDHSVKATSNNIDRLCTVQKSW